MTIKVRNNGTAEKGIDLETLLSVTLFFVVAYLSFSYVLPALKNHFASSQTDIFGSTDSSISLTK